MQTLWSTPREDGHAHARMANYTLPQNSRALRQQISSPPRGGHRYQENCPENERNREKGVLFGSLRFTQISQVQNGSVIYAATVVTSTTVQVQNSHQFSNNGSANCDSRKVQQAGLLYHYMREAYNYLHSATYDRRVVNTICYRLM